MKIAIAIAVLLATVGSAQARTFTEADFMRQSKTCEAATRLPWGDVDGGAWDDCMIHQQVRSLEKREADRTWLRTTWADDFRESQLAATADGCDTWARRETEDPPQMRTPDGSRSNHAWNLCMERQRIFTVPASRPPWPKPLDFREMAAQQRTTTITATFGAFAPEIFGCYTRERYSEIQKALISLFVEKVPKETDSDWRRRMVTTDEDIQEQRKLIEDSKDCRFFKVGTRVQVKAADEDMLCLSPAGAAERCYWTPKAAISRWE